MIFEFYGSSVRNDISNKHFLMKFMLICLKTNIVDRAGCRNLAPCLCIKFKFPLINTLNLFLPFQEDPGNIRLISEDSWNCFRFSIFRISFFQTHLSYTSQAYLSNGLKKDFLWHFRCVKYICCTSSGEDDGHT